MPKRFRAILIPALVLAAAVAVLLARLWPSPDAPGPPPPRRPPPWFEADLALLLDRSYLEATEAAIDSARRSVDVLQYHWAWDNLADLVPDPENWNYEKVRVVRALDGDTVELEDGRIVRLLGVDAPEIAHGSTPAEPGADEAHAFTQSLVGKTIRLYVHKDHPTDKYGRTLGLVFYWTGGSFNIDLIEKTPTEPDFLWMKPDLKDDVFRGAEAPQYGGVRIVNVNTADAATLATLPGIGATTAAAIVRYREANGPFASIADIDKVPGVGPATLSKIDGKIAF